MLQDFGIIKTENNFSISDIATRFLSNDYLNKKEILPIEISRGCRFKCTYCSYPLIGQKNMDDYLKFQEVLKEELLDNYNKWGVTQYYIVDDTFNDSREKLTVIRDMIVTLPFQPTFWCYARLDLIAIWPDTLDLLYQIGIRSMFFGIETLNRRTGLIIGKGYEKDKLIATVKTIKQRYPDIILYGSFIIGAPYESVESVKETQRLLCSGEFPLDNWKFNPLQIWRPTTINRTIHRGIVEDFARENVSIGRIGNGTGNIVSIGQNG